MSVEIEVIAAEAPARQALAFMLTDIEGSSARWERFPTLMGRIIARHDALITAAVAEAGGTVFKSTGDGLFASFPTAHQALHAAMAAQHALAGLDTAAIDGLAVRIAIHIGAVEARGGDYFGPAMNRAARLLGIAHGGQILLSEAAAEAARPMLASDAALICLGRHRLKDLIEAETVFQLRTPDLDQEFPALRSLDARPNNLPRQASRFIGREADGRAIASLLRTHRLITLLGPGGIGKTRLSLQ
ncbi:adenylate/guanylate cyclase domain-containing protein, partial [Acidiphilium sp.]|uniref:adenylate/guanylate cyclase domain-containing protein n=1 Tax=Acidiphilium sp. TaxID=527 RepID=UPI003D084AD8